MKPTFDLTKREKAVAIALVKICLDGMGGDRPSDLEHDEYTWVEPKDLVPLGYTLNEARGFFASLQVKGFVQDYDDGDWTVTTPGWRWVDTFWDSLE